MPNLLQNGVAWLASQQKANAAALVTYWRGGVGTGSSCPINATFGETRSRGVDANGFEIEVRIRDYLILTADLVLSGSVATPVNGDQIQEADGTVYEVAKPDTNEPAWRWSDPFRTRLRVHTKRVA